LRPLAVALVVVLATSCSAFGDASEALSSSRPSSSPSAASNLTGPTPTPAPDGKPAIVVKTPASGDQIVSPVEVSGRANVADGTVQVALVADDGTPLASTTAETDCGADCRGGFSVPVAFFVQERVAGTIQVFRLSREGATAIDVVAVPVTFVPGA